ncbi:unnamed protein product, partial [Urochloa humidicola]
GDEPALLVLELSTWLCFLFYLWVVYITRVLLVARDHLGVRPARRAGVDHGLCRRVPCYVHGCQRRRGNVAHVPRDALRHRALGVLPPRLLTNKESNRDYFNFSLSPAREAGYYRS